MPAGAGPIRRCKAEQTRLLHSATVPIAKGPKHDMGVSRPSAVRFVDCWERLNAHDYGSATLLTRTQIVVRAVKKYSTGNSSAREPEADHEEGRAGSAAASGTFGSVYFET